MYRCVDVVIIMNKALKKARDVIKPPKPVIDADLDECQVCVDCKKRGRIFMSWRCENCINKILIADHVRRFGVHRQDLQAHPR
jgi:hypothetical protein